MIIVMTDSASQVLFAPTLSASLSLCPNTFFLSHAWIFYSHEQIYFFQNAEGTGLSPFDSWLLLRGVKTMHIRVEKQQENAIRVARFLKAHPCTTHVRKMKMKIEGGFRGRMHA